MKLYVNSYSILVVTTNYSTLIGFKKDYSGLIRTLKSVGCPPNKFWGYLEAFFGGVCISQKLLRIQKYVGNLFGFLI